MTRYALGGLMSRTYSNLIIASGFGAVYLPVEENFAGQANLTLGMNFWLNRWELGGVDLLLDATTGPIYKNNMPDWKVNLSGAVGIMNPQTRLVVGLNLSDGNSNVTTGLAYQFMAQPKE